MAETDKPDPFAFNDAWLETVRAAAPKQPTAPPSRPRRVLTISECKGFQHKVTPHTAAVVRILGESGAFEVTATSGVMDFMPESLRGYNAIFQQNVHLEPDLRPLSLTDISAMRWAEEQGPHSGPCYAAWIKRYGRGRVFYCSPSHHPQSFEDPRLPQFLLDGIQDPPGDLKCDDASSPDAKASHRPRPAGKADGTKKPT